MNTFPQNPSNLNKFFTHQINFKQKLTDTEISWKYRAAINFPAINEKKEVEKILSK